MYSSIYYNLLCNILKYIIVIYIVGLTCYMLSIEHNVFSIERVIEVSYISRVVNVKDIYFPYTGVPTHS